jgi:hypothetical protein
MYVNYERSELSSSYRNFHFCGRLPHPIHGRGIPWGLMHHFKPKRVLTRHHPAANENRHKRTAQLIGSPRRGVINKD